MTNGEDFAYPQFGNNGGMTKREIFAAMAMQGLCANGGYDKWEYIANDAINIAETLIKALNIREQST